MPKTKTVTLRGDLRLSAKKGHKAGETVDLPEALAKSMLAANTAVLPESAAPSAADEIAALKKDSAETEARLQADIDRLESIYQLVATELKAKGGDPDAIVKEYDDATAKA